MIRKALALRIYDAANMQRWNDKICPVELKELDKQAHKMIIAYLLGKFEESREFDWTELIEGYCMLSAAPVGRYLLDLHGEARTGYRASDALCNALQVLNHLQDCQDDYGQLDRVYLPQDWMAAAGAKVEALGATAASLGLRRVIDRCLDGSDELIAVARTLPGQLKSRRLAMESAVIVRIAEQLSRLLRRRDPLAGRVKLSGLQFLGCGVTGIGWALLGSRGEGRT